MCCSGSSSSNDADTSDDGSFTASEHKCSFEWNFLRLRVDGDNFVVVIVLALLTYVDDDFNDDLLAELDEDAVLVDSSPTQRTECIKVVVISRERSVSSIETLSCTRVESRLTRGKIIREIRKGERSRFLSHLG